MEEFYPSAEMQSMYSTPPANWAKVIFVAVRSFQPIQWFCCKHNFEHFAINKIKEKKKKVRNSSFIVDWVMVNKSFKLFGSVIFLILLRCLTNNPNIFAITLMLLHLATHWLIAVTWSNSCHFSLFSYPWLFGLLVFPFYKMVKYI